MRRALVVLALLPSALAVAFVRPVSAAGEPVYDQVSLSAIAAAGHTNGVVGASGGLVTLDTGSAYVSFVPSQTNKWLMVGLNTDPVSDNSFGMVPPAVGGMER